jgi:hypothetical protein
LAVANYTASEKHFPPAYLADERGRPKHSWRILLLPWLEQGDLYREYNFEEPWDGPNNRKLAARMPRVYALHGDWQPGSTTTNYLAVVGPETVWRGSTGVQANAVKDGTSNTILLVENKGAGIHWMEPRDFSFAEMDYMLNSPRGISSRYADPAVVMLDSSIFRLTSKVDPTTLRALLTINGGEEMRWDQEHGWHLLPDGRQRPEAQP